MIMCEAPTECDCVCHKLAYVSHGSCCAGQIPRRAALEAHKHGAMMQISAEQLFEARGLADPRYARRHVKSYTPATPEAWDRYRAAVAGLAAFEAYEGSRYGGPDYGNEVPEPEPTITVESLETVDEWLDRCRTLDREAQA